MLRKSLLLAVCLSVLSAPMAFAGNGYEGRSTAAQGIYAANDSGVCYRGANGRGKPIDWVRDKNQCRTQSSGQSWGAAGVFENFHKGK